MNRCFYFNYIEEKLNNLSYRILNRGKLNILDLNIHAEPFYTQLMNILLDYSLININTVKQNAEAIDLVDEQNKIIIQVSSTCTKQKIDDSLLKINTEIYDKFTFMFIALSGDASSLRSKTYVSNAVTFNPANHIFDIKSILQIVLNFSISKQKKLFDFLKEELETESNSSITKLDSNLTTIINILSRENLKIENEKPEINSFEIERKVEKNSLESISEIIDDFIVYYKKINEKYNEFDKQRSNTSISVLSMIRKQYITLSLKDIPSHEIFLKIIDNLIEIIKNSKNYIEIPCEELEFCVSILTVDAFIKCKIFKNPEGYDYAVAR